MLKSGYKRLDGKEIKDIRYVPRMMNKKEKDEIIRDFPKVHGVTLKVREIARQNIEDDIRPRLERDILPSFLDELKKKIYACHLNSQVPPGMPIGTLAGEALGSTTTQTTLNTFHTAGSSRSASTGIEGIRELIYARRNRSNESCSIYFKNRELSLTEIFDKRAELVGSKVSDFVSKYEILKRVTPTTRVEYYDESELVEDSIWASLSGLSIPESAEYILRLHLNLDEMRKQYVTIKEIADSVCKEKKPLIVPVYGPMRTAIIDIYPTEEVKNGVMKDNNCKKLIGIPISNKYKEFVFLENCLVPCLALSDVKGIPGVKEIYPEEIELVSGIYKQRKARADDFPKSFKRKAKGNYWVLFLNKFFARKHGVKVEHISNLFREAKMEPVLEDANNGWVIIDIGEPTYKKVEDLGTSLELNATEKLSEIISSEKKLSEAILKSKQKKEKKKYGAIVSYIPEPTSILRKSKIIIADTEGSNLLGLYQQPGVDDTLTTCNNIYTATEILGIESAYNLYIRELDSTIRSNRSSINPVHIISIADFVMVRGIPRGTNFSGVSKQAGGPLELASIERAGKVISEAAFFGRHEIIKGISSSVIVNSRVEVGTGASSVGEDIIKNGVVVQTLLNEDVYKLHSVKNKFTEDQMLKEINEFKGFEDAVLIDRSAIDYDGPKYGEERNGEFVEGDEGFKVDINYKSNGGDDIHSKLKKSSYKKYSKTYSLIYNAKITGKIGEGFIISTTPNLSFLPSKSEESPTKTKIVSKTTVTKPAAKPVTKPAAKPVTKPAAKPVAKPATKEVTKKVVNQTLNDESEIDIKKYTENLSKLFG